jgi:oxygen-independent coproporphyrinogen-3 oxidase
MTALNEKKTEVGSYFISNYPPFSFWRKDHIPAALEALDRSPAAGAPLGLYLHIPFCRKRCKFCYFRVYTDKNSRDIERYLAALAREVEMVSERPAVAPRPFQFVYFGGGTPSYLSEKQLLGLVDRLRAIVSWDRAEEVTFECEPGTLSERKIETIREIGVTRLSLGVESFSDAILEENGRAHRSPEILRAYAWARKAGFAQVNIDLIAGMVGETWDSWRASVTKALELEPDSLTIYQLELPFNAVYAKSLTDGTIGGVGGIPVADWDLKREWVDWAFREAEGVGYHVSSAYTLTKDRSARFVYRDSLWHGADMIGCGVASFSHVGGVHYQNLDRDADYMGEVEAGRLPLSRALPASARDLLIRSLILQLKLGRIDAADLSKRFGIDLLGEFGPVFEELRAEGYVEPRGPGGPARIALTRRGLLRVDGLLPRFFDPAHRGARYT